MLTGFWFSWSDCSIVWALNMLIEILQFDFARLTFPVISNIAGMWQSVLLTETRNCNMMPKCDAIGVSMPE